MTSELTKMIVGARNNKVQGIDGGGGLKRTTRNKVDGAPRRKSLGLSTEHALGPVTVNAVIGKKAAEKSDNTPRSGAKSSKPSTRKLKVGRKQATTSLAKAAAAEPGPEKTQNADDEKAVAAAAIADGKADAVTGSGKSPENGGKVLAGAASRPKATKGSRNDKKSTKTPRSVVKPSKKQTALTSKEPKVGKAAADETRVQQTRKTDGKVGRRTVTKTAADKPKRKNEGKSLEAGRRKSLGGAVKDKATVMTATPRRTAPPKSTSKPTAKKEKTRGVDGKATPVAANPAVVITDLTVAPAAVKKSTKVKRVLKKKRKTVKSKAAGSTAEQIVRPVDSST